MVVDLWTDIVCPWCYIGVTRFERALERFNGDVQIRLHAFQLDPQAPVPGIPALQRYAQKFGAEAPSILERVQGEAAKDGIEMRFDNAITANTFDAHRLLRLASQSSKERELEMALYRAYFSDGLDVSDRSVLADRAAAAGMNREETLEYLESDRGVDEVALDIETAMQRGIRGVPAFVFEDQFLVPGAVDTETFSRILEQMQSLRAT
jgi:predicted DsbA family dithiol-disulfide isomerase